MSQDDDDKNLTFLFGSVQIFGADEEVVAALQAENDRLDQERMAYVQHRLASYELTDKPLDEKRQMLRQSLQTQSVIPLYLNMTLDTDIEWLPESDINNLLVAFLDAKQDHETADRQRREDSLYPGDDWEITPKR
ncbi:MAG: hypothetical protein H6867_11045 [Rhodospirillales bacterium]|nr:hypothetical protein [Rhodospirillales bacterium]MCB9996665.1 hypothetical protein [Rhodospirillales bacterium]